MNICKHNDFCGGCIYQGMDYGQQLRRVAYVITRSSKSKYREVYRQMDLYVPAGQVQEQDGIYLR